MKRIDQKDT